MKGRLILLAGLAGLAAPAFSADLEVTVHAVRNGAGQVKLMLFEREEGFRKEDQARQVLALPAASLIPLAGVWSHRMLVRNIKERN